MLPRTLIGAMSPQMSVLQRFGTPALDLNLAGDSTLDTRITATRASTKTYFDSTGTLQTAAIDAFPLEYDPSTLVCLGRSFWEARTNSIRNNTMQGASAGTPGTMPTNWSTFTTLTGLTREVVGSGTESGISYLDIRLSGTPSAAGAYNINFEAAGGVAMLTGQVWNTSAYHRLVSGSLTGISGIRYGVVEVTAASVFITQQFSANIATITSAGLATQRSTFTATLNGGGTTAFGYSFDQIILTGAAIDITLRIGMPQLELGATATPVIPTTTAATTRAADVVSMTGTNFSSWYNQTEGTFLVTVMVPYVTEASKFRRVIEANDTTINNIISIQYVNLASVNRTYGYINSGGVGQADLSTSSANGNTTAGTSYTSVIAYKDNNFAASHLGTSVLTDTTGTVPSASQLMIGQQPGAINQPNGFISRITYWNRRLSNADLQILSRST